MSSLAILSATLYLWLGLSLHSPSEYGMFPRPVQGSVIARGLIAFLGAIILRCIAETCGDRLSVSAASSLHSLETMHRAGNKRQNHFIRRGSGGRASDYG